MSSSNDDNSPVIRLWPAILIVSLQSLMMVTGFPFGHGKIIHGWILLLIWWCFFSRVPPRQRGYGLAALVVVGLLPRLLMHRSVDFVIFSFVVPTVTAAPVFAWLATYRVSWPVRRWLGLGAASLTFLVWTLVRVDGVSGDLFPEFAYRWGETDEQLFLAQTPTDSIAVTDAEPNSSPKPERGDWPGFRGANRDARVTREGLLGASLRKWQDAQPVLLWRRRIGPAWSSCAVVGELLVTQEQRGPHEVVSCYRADTGEGLWSHVDDERFGETLGGVGPRATPTVSDGLVFSVGATGIVNCLSAASGDLVWRRDLRVDTAAQPQSWGFTSSPLVVDGLVIVYGGGKERNALVAYETQSGEIAWTAGQGHPSYSSPQLVTLSGVQQVLMFTGQGLEAFVPQTGELLWTYEWSAADTMEARIIQPTVVAPDQVLVGSESKSVCLRVNFKGEQWQAEEMWSTRDLKPDFNDGAVHRGHLFGFDGSLLCCIDVTTGKRKWRSRGYGKGQLLLVPTADLLVVLSERGEIAVVEANAASCNELSRFRGIQGKSWNHPVIARGRLFVRNATEMACFALSPPTMNPSPKRTF